MSEIKQVRVQFSIDEVTVSCYPALSARERCEVKPRMNELSSITVYIKLCKLNL